MLSTRSLRVWSWLHKWTSLVSTVFMLLLCLTGLNRPGFRGGSNTGEWSHEEVPEVFP
jgi:hypothetical protein